LSVPRHHRLAEDYVRRLRQAGGQLPADRLRDLSDDIEAHLAHAISPDASDDEALEVLERLGPPGDIVDAEQPRAQMPVDRRTWREWAAVVLLPLGGLAFGVGWLIGLILLWSSRLWTTREKVIGTLIVPGGLATALLALLVVGASSSNTSICRGVAAQINPTTGQVIRPATPMHCTHTGGTSTPTTVWHLALMIFLILGPLISAAYLAHRAGQNSPTMTAVTL
jgi:hypothetical protein